MRIIAVLTAMALSTTAFAQTAAPLIPGKPAGVRQAQMTEEEWGLVGLGVAGAIAGIVALASSSSHAVAGGTTTTTTTTTTTSTTSTTGTSP